MVVAPELSVQQKELIERLKTQIRAAGPLSFAGYMSDILYAPQLGYYCSEGEKLGRGGDFITAPELSECFSVCVAKQCEQVLAQLSGGVILECGAGTGSLAAEVLRYLEKNQQLPEIYYIYDVSPVLRAQQQAHLEQVVPGLVNRVVWLDEWPQESIVGVILANEVLDALPVHLFKMVDGRVKEGCVTFSDDQFQAVYQEPVTDRFEELVLDLGIPFSDGYCSEINLNVVHWVQVASQVLEKGVVLLGDYGYPRHEYYHPDRSMGTLMCYHNHAGHDNPFIHVGQQDVTAHVDFTRVVEVALANGLDLGGFTNQASFLLNCHVLSDLPSMAEDVTAAEWSFLQKFRQLMLPGQMGEVMKLCALTKDHKKSLLGFSRDDQSDRLFVAPDFPWT